MNQQVNKKTEGLRVLARMIAAAHKVKLGQQRLSLQGVPLGDKQVQDNRRLRSKNTGKSRAQGTEVRGKTCFPSRKLNHNPQGVNPAASNKLYIVGGGK